MAHNILNFTNSLVLIDVSMLFKMNHSLIIVFFVNRAA